MYALAGVGQWTERGSVNQRVAGSIPSQGTCLGCGYISSHTEYEKIGEFLYNLDIGRGLSNYKSKPDIIKENRDSFIKIL